MAGIRGVAETYQQVSAISHQMRATSHSLISKSIDRTTSIYDQKVDNTHWQAGSSGLSLVAAGILSVMGAASENALLEAASKVSGKAGEVFNTVLHGYDIHHDSEIKKEDHALSMTKELERQTTDMDAQMARNVAQLMQQENSQFQLRG